jgi:hypothetical protein
MKESRKTNTKNDTSWQDHLDKISKKHLSEFNKWLKNATPEQIQSSKEFVNQQIGKDKKDLIDALTAIAADREKAIQNHEESKELYKLANISPEKLQEFKQNDKEWLDFVKSDLFWKETDNGDKYETSIKMLDFNENRLKMIKIAQKQIRF